MYHIFYFITSFIKLHRMNSSFTHTKIYIFFIFSNALHESLYICSMKLAYLYACKDGANIVVRCANTTPRFIV